MIENKKQIRIRKKHPQFTGTEYKSEWGSDQDSDSSPGSCSRDKDDGIESLSGNEIGTGHI